MERHFVHTNMPDGLYFDRQKKSVEFISVTSLTDLEITTAVTGVTPV